MADLLLLALGATLVAHFAGTGLPGVPPIVGAARRNEAAAGLGALTFCVLLPATGMAFVSTRVLLPAFAPGPLHPLVSLLFVAALAPLADVLLRRAGPRLPERVPGGVGLLATICAVLCLGFVRVEQRASLIESLAYAAAAAATFAALLVLFTRLDERVASGDVPQALRGAPIALLTAGLVALASIGLGGIGSP